MIPLSLGRLAQASGGELRGADGTIAAVTTDSRQALADGGLFVALSGERFDGHDFAADAVGQGATALLVERWLELSLPQIKVADTRLALGVLGGLVRELSSARVLAITGSCGKTTVKEMAASILHQKGKVLATRGNLNNEIGVPLTLCELTADTEYAVVELGANHIGEIAWTSSLTRPHAALINNVEASHLEGFGSLEGIARAKGEIYDGLVDGGVAIANGDSPFCALWRQQHELVYFGEQREYQARQISLDPSGCAGFRLLTPRGEVEVQLPVPGKHNVSNALAAAAGTEALGASLQEIAAGLSQFGSPKGRLQVWTRPGLTVLDDTYNASVASVLAGLDTLASLSGYRIFVFGDMAELGDYSKEMHIRVGEHARKLDIDLVLTVGRDSRDTASAAHGRHFEQKQQLQPVLFEALSQHNKVVVLIKGARSARMEEIVRAIQEGYPC
ncbi:UDP-N-acetylmuramoyl-tripeptide--D-alanyl-D-alanine ligase [Oceanisphaera psychrotolerans]|uniref:UDP-N-acetylmuramoyl-tripeptide--D-alanyl-D-alanine ligase n=1 Tax=Oceanisphaera psychrotolerans TaxID=1414654 RepID=A0A1J4QEB0_9GAMM|nr:UDP-N-acetylmuramoyl-tripeptide--D-alanyl-D-alanine ligase [Oceanisphaera psychrotolerans]OIN09984.1 UDP-N-acetylmuramoyl-tripeptide--D-alanyl-D-alanine ligase [Oceanisphaera psychrotolerans]